MATAAATLPNQAQVYNLPENIYSRNKFIVQESSESTVYDLQLFKTNSLYVYLHRSIMSIAKSKFPSSIDIALIKDKMPCSLNLLVNLIPDVMSAELTLDKSIFYTLKKKDYTFFVEHFLDEPSNEDDAILSIYKGKDKLPSMGGSLKEIDVKLCSLLSEIEI